MEKENNNTNMTVGVVLTVAVAILLLVAMIPAMMPAQEGGDGPTTYHYVTLETADHVVWGLFYCYADENGETISRLPVASFVDSDGRPNLEAQTSSMPESPEERNGYPMLSILAPPDYDYYSAVYFGGPDGVDVAKGPYTYWFPPMQMLDQDNLVQTLGEHYAVYDSDALWDAFHCPNVVMINGTFDPSTAVPDEGGSSGGSVDTNTVLIGAIISLLFISIALVAVRSFRA